jgi:hypothetical protein
MRPARMAAHLPDRPPFPVSPFHSPPDPPPGTAHPDEIQLTEDLVRRLRDHLMACEAALARAGADAAGVGPDWCRDLRGELETHLIRQSRLILSMHIPLAEAPGFRQLLADIFGEGFFLHYREITNCRGQIVRAYSDDVRCIHGHFMAESLRASFPQARLVTWVREPVQRVVAQYHYWQREPDWGNPVCQALHRQQWSLVDFARQDLMRNKMSRHFGNLRSDDFAFIGVLEAFPRSVDLMRHRLQLTAVPRVEAYRATEYREEVPEVSAAEKEAIADFNEQDGHLYAECCAWFQRACREFKL